MRPDLQVGGCGGGIRKSEGKSERKSEEKIEREK